MASSKAKNPTSKGKRKSIKKYNPSRNNSKIKLKCSVKISSSQKEKDEQDPKKEKYRRPRIGKYVFAYSYNPFQELVKRPRNPEFRTLSKVVNF